MARTDTDPETTGAVQSVRISISSGTIDFHTTQGFFRYDLEQTGLTEGDFTATVRVTDNDVDFTLMGMEGEFEFSYRIRPGQPNPSTFFGGQSTVPFHITREAAPTPEAGTAPPETPGTVGLTLEEAIRRCEANQLPGIKVFPFRGTRFGAAPIWARREGGQIVVEQPVYVLANDDFRAQTRTLPTQTFISGVRLEPNELVRVHVYEPRWYHLNITGSTEGDIEREFCATGEQMLEIAAASRNATLTNIGLTVVEGATLFIPVGRLASYVAKPVLGAGRTLTAAAMIGTAEAAPRAIGAATTRAAVTVVEEQVVTRAAGQTLSRTVAQTILRPAGEAVAEAAPRAVGALPRVTAGVGTRVVGTGALETGAETAGGAIRSAVTPRGGVGSPGTLPPGGGEGTGLNVLVVGAETEAEFAYARQVANAGSHVVVVNPEVRGAASEFIRSGGNFVHGRIEDLPRQPVFHIIREDFPFPLGRVIHPTEEFAAERLTRLAPGGRWVVVTESPEFAQTLRTVAELRGARVTMRDIPAFHEATPQSVYPREITRFVMIIE